IVGPQRATMSQQSSLTQSAHSVRQVLTAYSESLKINMFRMPCGLVAAWAAQHERFEGGHTAVWTRYVVVGDLDRGEVAALRPGIDGECGEAVGVRRVSHRRPGRVLLHVDRRTLACCRVGFADAGDHATLRRGGKKIGLC